MGAALMAGAKTILVLGELDAQCDEEFVIVVESILMAGLSEVDDGKGWTVEAGCCSMIGDASDMMQILAEGTHKLCDALSHWSAAKVLSEEEALSELLSHLSRHIAVYDAGKMSKTVLAMEQARSAWEERFLAIEGKWPPEGLSQGRVHRFL